MTIAPTPALLLSPAVAGRLDASAKVVRSIGDALGDWLDLAIRFWIAQAFLAGAAVTLVMGTPLAMAGPGVLAAGLNHLVASPFGVLVQTICPVLVLMGLFTRVAAIPLLIEASLLHGPSDASIVHVSWSLLLGWMIVMGPGPFSLDALFERGIDSSAIPGARSIGILVGGVTRRVGPWYRLLLRLGIASATLAGIGTALGFGPAWRSGDLGPWFAAMPHEIAVLPPGLSILLGCFLAIGLGTRLCALLLLIAIPIGEVGMSVNDRFYWAALLGILLCKGAGPFGLDALIGRALDTVGRRMRTIDAALPHVVILGGGFGGVAAAHGLKGAPCRITLVDRNNHHLFQPLLYQVATAGLSPAAIATPIRSLFRSQDNLRVLLAEARGVSIETAEVILDQGRLAYDYLVVATGARHSYFGRDDWASDAPGLKRVEDATEIRRRLLIGFERAEGAADPLERARWMTFVIVGGGPTGVELAGAIAELARHGLKQDYRTIDPASARVILVQSADRLLPTFPATLSAYAAEQLAGLGVEVLTGAKVEQIDAQGVMVGAARIEARTVLWAAGVAASPAGQWLGGATDRAGRVMVGPDLSVTPDGVIFALGDTAASNGWNGASVPGLAPAAKQSGQYLARVIRARLAGRPPPGPFRYRHAGSLATIGRRAAVAEFGPVKVRGALAWWIWGVIHILFLAGGRNRATVMLEWVWAYMTYRRGSQLITDPRGLSGDPS